MISLARFLSIALFCCLLSCAIPAVCAHETASEHDNKLFFAGSIMDCKNITSATIDQENYYPFYSVNIIFTVSIHNTENVYILLKVSRGYAQQIVDKIKPAFGTNKKVKFIGNDYGYVVDCEFV